jgi:predicted AlkP superfamily pyrophosphatase or phosphodiesterase
MFHSQVIFLNYKLVRIYRFKKASVCMSMFGTLFIGCSSHENIVTPSVNQYLTQNVIIATIDGPRYSETWGSIIENNIPFQTKLAEKGVFFSNFYNDGVTNTLSGHTAITTGHYEDV